MDIFSEVEVAGACYGCVESARETGDTRPLVGHTYCGDVSAILEAEAAGASVQLEFSGSTWTARWPRPEYAGARAAFAASYASYPISDGAAQDAIVDASTPIGATVDGPYGTYRRTRRHRIRYSDVHGTRTMPSLSQRARDLLHRVGAP